MRCGTQYTPQTDEDDFLPRGPSDSCRIGSFLSKIALDLLCCSGGASVGDIHAEAYQMPYWSSSTTSTCSPSSKLEARS